MVFNSSLPAVKFVQLTRQEDMQLPELLKIALRNSLGRQIIPSLCR
jgi:hypothetical protein